MKPEPPLTPSANGADEMGSGPPHVPRRDAVLHAGNRTRSARLCKRTSDAFQLLR
jgi:hypothetical protein